MNITLTEQESNFLKEFATKQGNNAKDNVGTMTPIHVVERIRKEFVEDNSGEVFLRFHDDHCDEYGSIGALV